MGVEQQARRLAAEARIDVGVIADVYLFDRCRAQGAQLGAKPLHQRALVARRDCGCRTNQLGEPFDQRSAVPIAGVIQCLRSVSPARRRPRARLRPGAARSHPPALPPRPHIAAARTPQPPVIDGRLDDAVWARAASDAFVQHFPDEGAPPSERTDARALDDENLYVAVDCEQLNAPIVRRLARRDSQIPSDGVWIDIDSRRTGVGAFHFAVNAAGMLSDGIHFDDTGLLQRLGRRLGSEVADTGRGYAIDSASRCRCCASRRCPCRTGVPGAPLHRRAPGDRRLGVLPAQRRDLCPAVRPPRRPARPAPRHALELRPFVLGRGGYRAADADTTLTHGWSAGGRSASTPARTSPTS